MSYIRNSIDAQKMESDTGHKHKGKNPAEVIYQSNDAHNEIEQLSRHIIELEKRLVQYKEKEANVHRRDGSLTTSSSFEEMEAFAGELLSIIYQLVPTVERGRIQRDIVKDSLRQEQNSKNK